MFFKVLAAIVTADAFDRHARERRYRAWIGEDAGRREVGIAPMPDRPSAPAEPRRWDLSAPERPT